MPENVLDAPVADQVAPPETDPFDTPPRDLPKDDGDALSVSVDGFEGPLDLLLMLARTQKVDLRKVSVLQLAEQYLEFVNKARSLRLELAADYLVMAAWLAFLKSRLLLPPPLKMADPAARNWPHIWPSSLSGLKPCAALLRN